MKNYYQKLSALITAGVLTCLAAVPVFAEHDDYSLPDGAEITADSETAADDFVLSDDGEGFTLSDDTYDYSIDDYDTSEYYTLSDNLGSTDDDIDYSISEDSEIGDNLYAVTSWSKGGREVVRVWTNKTGSTPSITLKLEKGTYSYTSLTGKKKTDTAYGYYNITVKPISTIDGGKTSYKQSTTSISSASKKINLKKNTYYEIVISWNDWYALNCLNALLDVHGFFPKWTSYPKWSVKATKNCGNYQ